MGERSEKRTGAKAWSDEDATIALNRRFDCTDAAVISPDGLYRYQLTRTWGRPSDPRICWVMLNPSTADALVDDPTIRRCIGFSERWGFGSLVVVNLFALRSTDPSGLLRSEVDPIGPSNDHAIRMSVGMSNKVIAAWGTKGGYRQRNADVLRLINHDQREDVYCLATTAAGHPKHPLYMKGTATPTLFRGRTTAYDLAPASGSRDGER